MTRKLPLMMLLMTVFFPLRAQEFRAVLEPREQTLFTSEVQSTVDAIERKMGESFQEGDRLITLDTTVYLANYTKAKALLAKAQTDFEVISQLYQDKVASHSELRDAEAAKAIAEADLAMAKKAYESCHIDAPYTGKVVTVFVKEYERVQVGQTLIEILDDGVLIAKLLIPERFLNEIAIGDDLQLTIQETGTSHTAKVLRIGAVLDPVSSLLKVDAEIDNRSGNLRTGMEGSFRLGTEDVQ